MTPEQEEQVRRALQTAARSDEPTTMPPEVAARLDDVLAELAAPRSQAPVPDDELAHRRRRRWPTAIVAAAVVAVMALVGGAVATRGYGTLGSGESTSAGNAASSQDTGVAKDDSTARSSSAPSPSAPAATSSQRRQSLAGEGARPGRLPALRTPTLTQDVRRALRQPPAVEASSRPFGCARPVTGHGDTLLAVRLDGRRATLLASPVRHGRQEARVYSCDDGDTPVATVSVTAR